MALIYPTAEEIIEVNKKVLDEIKVRKADQHKVLSRPKIENVLNLARKKKGYVVDKAVVILKGLIQAHAFSSGNRRTAFVVTQEFLSINGLKLKIADKENAYILQGIRENYYSDQDIGKWLTTGKLHEFERK